MMYLDMNAQDKENVEKQTKTVEEPCARNLERHNI